MNSVSDTTARPDIVSAVGAGAVQVPSSSVVAHRRDGVVALDRAKKVEFSCAFVTRAPKFQASTNDER